MVFALDHADANKEISTTIAESLTLGSTAPATKVARLYLLSDILHNSQSGVKNASYYRTLFEQHLRDIMRSFGESLRNSGGRMTALALKDQVGKVLQVWDKWSLYPTHFIAELQALFLDLPLPSVQAAVDENVDGEPMDEDIDGEDLDGEALDGEPLGDIDGEDLDGEALDGEDLDGEALDGEPM